MGGRSVEAPALRHDQYRATRSRKRALPALIAFGMFLPLIGLHTVQDIHNDLVLETRWPLLAVFVVLAMAGRLFGSLVVAPWRARRAARPPAAADDSRHAVGALPRARRHRLRRGLPAGRPVARRARRGGEMGRQFRHPDPDLRDARAGASTSWSGSPACSTSATSPSMPSAPIPTRCWRRPSACPSGCCLPLAGILAAFWGIMLGFPVLRLRGDYLAIVTLAFGEIIRLVLINWVPVTNGYAGISGIPRPTFFGLPFNAAGRRLRRRLRPRIQPDPAHRSFSITSSSCWCC